jgi:hypothetical protein
MNDFEATAILVALFALRCIAPVVLTLVVGYLMNRLVERWHEEDAAVQVAEPALPSIPAPSRSIKLPTVTVPCWILRNCEETQKADCPAAKQPGLPCWLVRLRADGRLPATCPDCPIYAQAMVAPA